MEIVHAPDHDLLIRLDQKVDNLTTIVSTLTDDHEKRIRAIEKYVWKFIGSLLVVDAIMTAAIAFIISYISTKH